MDTKTCKTCGANKPLSDYYFNHNFYRGSCKECNKAKHKKWAENNKNHLNSYHRNLYHTNSSYRKTCMKCSSEYYHNPKNKTKIRRVSLIYGRKWRQNPKNRILASLRRRFAHVLNGNRKTDSTLKLIGCSKEYLINHIEKQFQPGMTWENYGFYGWHVDHITPCASFDLSKEDEQRKCFHYTNIQPLWAKDNLKKKDKIIFW